MPISAILPLVFVFWSLATARSATGASPPDQRASFDAAVALLQKGEAQQGLDAFTTILSRDPLNPVILNNAAIAAQRNGQLGLALGLWRRALHAHPGFEPALSSIRWAENKLERKEIPHEVEIFETLRASILVMTPIDAFLFVTAITLVATGWLGFQYLGARRRALADEQPLPSLPVIGLASGVVLLVSLVLTSAKIIDMRTPRATVIVKKVEARSAPDSSATALFEIYEGLEVIIRQSSGDWTQVTYPGASTGWIQKSTLFPTKVSE